MAGSIVLLAQDQSPDRNRCHPFLRRGRDVGGDGQPRPDVVRVGQQRDLHFVVRAGRGPAQLRGSLDRAAGDLRDDPGKGRVGKCVDQDARGLADLQLRNIGLVHLQRRLDGRHVRDRHQNRARVVHGSRHDHLSLLDVAPRHDPVNGRTDLRLHQLVAGRGEIGAGSGDLALDTADRSDDLIILAPDPVIFCSGEDLFPELRFGPPQISLGLRRGFLLPRQVGFQRFECRATGIDRRGIPGLIDHEEQVPLADGLPLLHVQPGNLSHDVGRKVNLDPRLHGPVGRDDGGEVLLSHAGCMHEGPFGLPPVGSGSGRRRGQQDRSRTDRDLGCSSHPGTPPPLFRPRWAIV